MPRDILLGNGRFAVGFDETFALRELTFPFVGQENQTLGRRSHWGLLIEDGIHWCDEPGWSFRRRIRGACGRRARQEATQVETGRVLTIDLVVDPRRRHLRRRFRLQDPRTETPSDAVLLLRHDLVLGESDIGNAVAHDAVLDGVHHYRRDRHVLIRAEEGLRGWTLAREDDHEGEGVRGRFLRFGLDGNPCAVGAGDSLIGVALRANGPAIDVELIAGTSVEDLRPDDDHDVAESLDDPAPGEFSDDLEVPLDHQRLEAIARGQLRAHQDAGGAIMAGLDSEMVELARESYAYCWPRDGALVARAALERGAPEVTARFLDFARRTLHPEGYFLQRYHADGQPASSWHPRPARGEGLRPIQEDETALTALVTAEYLAAIASGALSAEAATVTQLQDDLLGPALRFLLDYRDERTGLPLPSHDLWEERFGVHTFTVVAVEAALRAGARVRPEDAAKLEDAAQSMGDARRHYLFHRDLGRFARRLERHGDDHHLDMTIDASLAGLSFLDPEATQGAEEESTLDALAPALTVPEIGGIARYEGDQYHRAADLAPSVPGNPWLLCTAWIAALEARRADGPSGLDRARAHLDWILRHAGASGALSEQLDAATGADHSIRPLTWSHAEYLVARGAYRAAAKRLGLDHEDSAPAGDPW